MVKIPFSYPPGVRRWPPKPSCAPIVDKADPIVTLLPHFISSLRQAASPFTFIMGQTLFTLVAAIPAAMLTEKFTDLWPDVELRMGREYAQVTRKRRNLVWLIMSFAVLP